MALPPRPVRAAQRMPPPRRTSPVARTRPDARRRGCAGSLSLWLLLLLGVIVVIGAYVYDRTFGTLDTVQVPQVVPTVVGQGPPAPLLTRPFNILLIGVDLRKTRLEDGARSDTLIVVRVDPQAKTAAMLSVPRDTYIDPSLYEQLQLPDGAQPSGHKVNAAFAYGYKNPDIYAGNTDPQVGGANLARQTVEQLLGIKIDYSAQIDFQGFQALIDQLGGVAVDVPHAILDAEYPTDDEGYMRLFIPPGLQRMDGVTALRYARTRHADNDFGRAKRQQQVLQAVLDELKQRGLLGKIEAVPTLLNVLRASVRTDLPISDLTNLRGLAALGQSLTTDRIARYTLEPGTDHILDSDGSDIHWAPEYVAGVAAKFMSGPQATAPAPEQAVIQVQNGKGVKGLASQVTLELRLAKLTTVEPTDAPDGSYPHTLVLDYSGNPATTRRLAALFNIDAKYVKDMTAQAADAPLGVDIVLVVGDDYEPPSTSQTAPKR